MGLPAVSYDHCREMFDHGKLDPDEAREAREAQYIEAWIEDDLVPDAIVEPIHALVEDESGLFQAFLQDYERGDSSAFDHSSGAIARALREHIKRSAA
ncbi:hypothetical protein [Halomonas cupida]|uniref:hypothetical protein n=1 Tax=Halomonas cupida TaxID=44933 RepID=UPI003A8F1400